MGNGLRYGLLAALTGVLASALVWDRLHPPRSNSLLPRDGGPLRDTARIRIGGSPAAPPTAVSTPSRPPGTPALAPAAASPGAAAAVAPPPAAGTCTVAAGDTLGEIALRTLGTSRKAGELARHNGLDPDATLRVGVVLRLPAAAVPAAVAPAAPSAAPAAPPIAASVPAPVSRSHLVAKGETLTSIARRYYGPRGSYRRIAEANGLAEDAVLRDGRTLVIP